MKGGGQNPVYPRRSRAADDAGAVLAVSRIVNNSPEDTKTSDDDLS